MTATRRREKRCHMMMWAILTHPHPVLHWRYLLEWAVLGGNPDEAPK